MINTIRKTTFLLSLLGGLSAIHESNAATVKRFGVFETAFEASATSANPYVSQEAVAELIRPDGNTWRLPLFWDGGKTFRLRVSPDLVGEWSFTVQSSDPGLNGKTGRFNCSMSSRCGSIRPMTGFPHHFERQDGSRFWFMGDTGWLLFTDDSTEKFDRTASKRYVSARADQGFNVVHTSLLAETGDGNNRGKPWDSLAIEKLNPGYWQEVDRRIEFANSKGVIIGLALAWGNKRGKDDVEPYSWGRFPSMEARLRYARYIAARYGAYEVYFLVSGEWHGEIKKRQSTEAEARREFFAIGDALKAADAHGRMIGIHPMTEHGSVREFNQAGWMSFGDYQQNYNDLHARVLESGRFNKPVVNSEYGYFLRDSNGDGVPDKENSTSIEAMRHATWDIAMAGGYVVTGFGTTYFGGKRDPGPFDLEAAKNKPWEQQMGAMKKFFTGLQWWRLVPHDELLRCALPRGVDRTELNRTTPPTMTYWCLAETGRQYVLYVRGLNEPLELSLSEGGHSMQANQWNPRTGEFTQVDAAPADGRFIYRPPDAQDWVVILTSTRELHQ